MSTPWETLGLDPESVDAESVRRAYIRLVKRHRPDREPQRFQEVREAYDIARRLLQLAEQTGIPLTRFAVVEHEGQRLIVSTDETPGEDEASGESPVEAPAAEPEPSAFVTERLPAIQAALAGGEDAEASRLLREAHGRWRGGFADAEAFPELVHEVPDAYVHAVGDDAALEDALTTATSGEGAVFTAVAGAWTRRGAWGRLQTLGDRLLVRDESGAERTLPLGFAMAACATALALADPARAARLAEAAHVQLEGPWRDGALREADVRLAMAAELADVPEADRRELARLLAARDAVPTSGPAFLALRKAMLETHPEGLTNVVLAERYPDLAQRVDRSRQLGVVAQQKAASQRSRSNAWWWIMAVIIAVNLMRFLGERTSEVDRWTRDGPVPREVFEPTYPRTRDALRDIDGVLETLRTDPGWLDAARKQVLRDQGRDPAAADATLRGEGSVRRGSAQHVLMLTVFRDDLEMPAEIRERCADLLQILDPDGR